MTIASNGFRRALIVHTGGGLGDLLVSSPIADALRRQNPQLQITWWASTAHAPILEHLPATSAIWTQAPDAPLASLVRAIRRAEYDVVLLPWTTGRQALVALLARIPVRVGQAERAAYSWMFTHRVVVRSTHGDVTSHWGQCQLDYARALGCDVGGLAPAVCVTDDERREARALLASWGVAPDAAYCTLHIGKGLPLDRIDWPTRRFVEIGRRLADDCGWTVLLTGTAAERHTVERTAAAIGLRAIPCAGRTTIRQLAAIVEGSAVCVATDGGPMHVAAAVGTPVVGLFAITSDVVARWRPTGARTAVVGTGRRNCPRDCVKESCRDFACIGEIDVDAVLDAVRQVAVR